jgi:hypothetical protein
MIKRLAFIAGAHRKKKKKKRIHSTKTNPSPADHLQSLAATFISLVLDYMKRKASKNHKYIIK